MTGRVIDDGYVERARESPPRSPHASDGLARPDVVWFGESLPGEVFEASVRAMRDCSVCLAIGTSALVEPAASLPLLASETGAMLVEINPQSTPLSPCADIRIRYGAGAALVALATAIEGL